MKSKLGTGNPNCKLSEANVHEIRRLAKTSIMKKEIAKKFKITPTMVSYIVTGKRWTHI